MEEFGAYCARARRGQRAAELRAICTESRLSLAPLLDEAPAAPVLVEAGRKRARPGPTMEPFLRRVEAFLGPAPAARAVSRAAAGPRRLRVPARRVHIGRAAHLILVHDGAAGALARHLGTLGLPRSVDVVVPSALVDEALLHWGAVYPGTRRCFEDPPRVDTSGGGGRRRARSDRRGLRLWSVDDYLSDCYDRNDVLVAEEMQDWPTTQSLLNIRVRAVVVGCAGVCSALRALLPHLGHWNREVFDARLHVGPRRRRVAKATESKLSAPFLAFPSAQYLRWVATLADELLITILLALRSRGALAKVSEVSECWKAFVYASAFADVKVRRDPDGLIGASKRWEDVLEFLGCWTVRAALLAYSSPARTREQVRCKAAGLRPFFGDDLSLVCAECLALGPHSSCDWDLRTQPPEEVPRLLVILGAPALSGYVARITSSRALLGQKVLRAASGASSEACPATTGLLLLRSWARSLQVGAEIRDTLLDEGSMVLSKGNRGGALHLRGRGAMSLHTCGASNDCVLGAPVVGESTGAPLAPLAPLAPGAMADSLALRTFTAHMVRTHHLVLRVAHPFLLDFLAVNWRILAGPVALLRRSLRTEITEVNVYPSVLLEDGVSMRRIRARWPNARIFWHAALDGPVALAMHLMFNS